VFGLGKYGNGIGLHRARRFFDDAHIPHDYFAERSIVVTGSNGKGSTTRMIYGLLQTQFAQVGCFISPHLIDVTERFEISGQQITPAELHTYKDRVLAFNASLPDGDFMGAFELLFYVAVQWFYARQADVIVWEAGIGGRYDPTRSLAAPISALTSLDLEHTELLGATRELIAYDKLDVTRPNGESVISSSVDAALYERLRAYAAISGKTFHFIADHYQITALARLDGQQQITVQAHDGSFPTDGLTIPLQLLGQHQAENALTALDVTRRFLARHQRQLPPAEIVGALPKVTWPGRLEQISRQPNVWIDVGHTPDAITRVIEELLQRYSAQQMTVVYGVSYNKSAQQITALIETHFERVILTRAYKNGTPIQLLADTFSAPHKIIAQFDTVEGAAAYARDLASDPHSVIVVLGGLFLAIEFKVAFAGDDPQALNFF
jgi:dihydrofolate synthase/folylpolyglutamate synthase